ncbi:hypothetical protein FOPE_08410 [Fonsecaea pedrosoi]|nr:hypothetical protein FOPE_08410 [Fonsecaea pedrosoi]
MRGIYLLSLLCYFEDRKFPYELEILDPDWEITALDKLVSFYTSSRTWPRSGAGRRWPTLQDQLPFTQYQGSEEFGVWFSPRLEK